MVSAEEREQLLIQVKRDVRSLLISAKSGLAIPDLYRDYQSLVFNPLPFRQLGFETARAFLQSIPDVCRCQLLPGGDCLVTAVADSSTAHIQKMVQRQKSRKRGAKTLTSDSPHALHSATASRSSAQSAQTQDWHRSSNSALARSETQQEPRTKLNPVPSHVAARLSQLLLARQDGVLVDSLPELYRAAVPDGDPLDWTGLGYRSCAELLLQLPLIARVSSCHVYPADALLGEQVTGFCPCHSSGLI